MYHFSLVKAQQWRSEAMYYWWWSRWISWLGGPIYRYFVATVISYWLYTPDEALPLDMYPPQVSGGPMVYTVCGAILAVMVCILEYYTLRNMLNGITWIEDRRLRYISPAQPAGAMQPQTAPIQTSPGQSERLVWVPDLSQSVDSTGVYAGSVLQVPYDAKLYNRGRAENWRSIFGRTWFDYIGRCFPAC